MSPEWAALYASGENPTPMISSEIAWMISIVSENSKVSALELGCAFGQHSVLFNKPIWSYEGIDGSPDAIEAARKRYPGVHFYVKDFTRCEIAPNKFNIIFDRASVSHNDLAGIVRTIDAAYEALPVGGLYCGADWFSMSHSEAARGEPCEELNTRTNYTDGQFKNVGTVHFTNLDEIKFIFRKFRLELVWERIRVFPPGFPTETCRMPWVAECWRDVDYKSSVYDIIARKI